MLVELDARPEWTDPDLIEWLDRDAKPNGKPRSRDRAARGPSGRGWFAMRPSCSGNGVLMEAVAGSWPEDSTTRGRLRGAGLGRVGPGTDRHRAALSTLWTGTPLIPRPMVRCAIRSPRARSRGTTLESKTRAGLAERITPAGTARVFSNGFRQRLQLLAQLVVAPHWPSTAAS